MDNNKNNMAGTWEGNGKVGTIKDEEKLDSGYWIDTSTANSFIDLEQHQKVSEEMFREMAKEKYGEEDLGLEERLGCDMENIKSIEGYKEKEGKIFYEFDWNFIEEMAKRMAANKKDKYPPYNWKKPIDTEELKQAINRHHIEVMKGKYRDGDEEFGHVTAYAVNSMMLYYQLKNQN